MSDNLCIYHGGCADGWTSAWIVAHAVPGVELFQGFYNETPPNVKDKTVYIVDFSFRREIMEQIAHDAKRVIHIDHHASAIRDMEGFDGIEKFYSYDNKKSGAMLCWEYFYPGIDPIPLVKIISDRDTWQFTIDRCREASANIFSYSYTMENWDMLAGENMVDLITPGIHINRRHMKDVSELVGVLTRKLKIDGHIVPALNVPYTYGSEACALLSETAPFAAYYYDKPTHREYGLRSSNLNPDHIDVSVIAKKFGGGGHKHSAGFKLPFSQTGQFEIE